MKRRDFIQMAGISAVAASTTASSQSVNPQGLKVRKSALQLPANDPVFSQYAAAVKKMHELPASDKRSWMNQAKIHADRCPHGTIGFFPWHRQYVLYFEKICGELIGNPQFALPYWDWTDKSGLIPDAFFDIQELNVTFWKDPGKYNTPIPTGWPNIDTLPIRAVGKGFAVQDDPVRGGAFTSQTINNILTESDFNKFHSRVERTPHNTGHVVVGFPASGKAGHIGSGLSPLDPLFWLHHCNVDRLWAQWQLAGNQTPVFNLAYDGQFFDAQGNSVNVTADAAKDFMSLGYTYDSIGDPNALAKLAMIIPADAPANTSPFALIKPKLTAAKASVIGTGKSSAPASIGEERKVTVQVSGLKAELAKLRPVLGSTLPPLDIVRSQKLTSEMFTSFGKQEKRPRRIMAQIKGLKATGFESDPVVNVFVNCPYLSPTTSYKDPHFAGTFALFGASSPPAEGGGAHDHGAHGDAVAPDYFVDLTNAVSGLDQDKLDSLDVQFMTVAGDVHNPGKGSISFDSLDIVSV